MSDWVGRTLSKVEIQELLGRGGMADVFLGRHTTLNRPVAVKVMHAHFSDNEALQNRFIAEAQYVAALRHPHIVQVFDYDTVDGRPYMIMELLDGVSLKEYLNKLTVNNLMVDHETVVHLLAPIADALEYAHQRGIVHRDLKPANIMLRSDTGEVEAVSVLPSTVEPILTDFGVAHIADAAGLTASGAVIGTPAYMSPEQVRGEKIDSRSDIYALGVMLYEMLAGVPPFEGETQASIMIKHMTETPPKVSSLSPQLQEVLDRSLTKSADDRYQTANALIEGLRAALGDQVDDSDSTHEEVDNFAATLEMAAIPKSMQHSKEEEPVLNPTEAGDSTSIDVEQKSKGDSKKLLLPIFIGGGLIVMIGVVLIVVFVGSFLSSRLTDNAEPSPPTEVLPEVADNPDIDESADSNDSAAAAEDQPEEEPTSTAIDTTTPQGTIIFRDSTITMLLDKLPPLDDGAVYMAWLTDPESEPLFLGTIESKGSEVSFTDPEGRDLLMLFSSFGITEGTEPDAEPVFNGPVIYKTEVEPQVILDYRHLKDTSGASFDQAIRDDMVSQASTFSNHITLSLDGILLSSSLSGGKNHAEHAINIAAGLSSPDYADWDEDGRPENPGDDVGLLPYLGLFANAVHLDDAEIAGQIDELIAMIEDQVSLLMKITSSDTVEEAATHAEELNSQQGQVLEHINALIEATQSIDMGTHFEVFATGN